MTTENPRASSPAAKSVRRAIVLCCVAGALALVLAAVAWFGNGLSGEPDVPLDWRLAVLPPLFLAAGVIALAAAAFVGTAPWTGAWLAVLAAVAGFAGAALQQSWAEALFTAAVWLLVTVPALLAARSALRAARTTGPEAQAA